MVLWQRAQLVHNVLHSHNLVFVVLNKVCCPSHCCFIEHFSQIPTQRAHAFLVWRYYKRRLLLCLQSRNARIDFLFALRRRVEYRQNVLSRCWWGRRRGGRTWRLCLHLNIRKVSRHCCFARLAFSAPSLCRSSSLRSSSYLRTRSIKSSSRCASASGTFPAAISVNSMCTISRTSSL